MRELKIPPETEGDEKATEMMRVCLAHGNLHVSLLLGMWADAENCGIDERDAWGELLADTIQHIANGLSQSHSWNKEQTAIRITNSFLKNIKSPQGLVTGEYMNE